MALGLLLCIMFGKCNHRREGEADSLAVNKQLLRMAHSKTRIVILVQLMVQVDREVTTQKPPAFLSCQSFRADRCCAF